MASKKSTRFTAGGALTGNTGAIQAIIDSPPGLASAAGPSELVIDSISGTITGTAPFTLAITSGAANANTHWKAAISASSQLINLIWPGSTGPRCSGANVALLQTGTVTATEISISYHFE